jgi:hypothetical protein
VLVAWEIESDLCRCVLAAAAELTFGATFEAANFRIFRDIVKIFLLNFVLNLSVRQVLHQTTNAKRNRKADRATAEAHAISLVFAAAIFLYH